MADTDLFQHLDRLGISIADGAAARDYAAAQTEDELRYAAGEHLALHAVTITKSLGLPKRGASSLALMQYLSSAAWKNFWTIQNDAFCLAALIDLCTVRTVFKQEQRWPELSALLDWTFVMAGVYRCRGIKMSSAETKQFRDHAATHLIDFQEHVERAPPEQIALLMALDGLSKDRVDKAAFLRATISEPSWVDPWALIRHHDRIAAASGQHRR